MVSIILPVYNTGEVLRPTIDSVLSQTYTDWELLLIDDGSTDGSGAICEEYAAKDSRIRVIHKTNGGICNARNCGLSLSKGKYIAFCDHDDLYHPELLATAITGMEKYSCDVLCYRYEIITDDYQKTLSADISESLGDYPIIVHDVSEVFCKLYENASIETVWSMIYRTSLIKDSVTFDETFRYGGEDINFNLQVMALKPRLAFIRDVLYTHFVRGSLSTSAKFHMENHSLMLRHLRDYNKTILSLGIDINDYVGSYYNSFARLLKNSLSFAVRCGFTKKEFSVLCRESRRENLLGDSVKWKYLQAVNGLEKYVLLVFFLRFYWMIYWCFKISWRRKLKDKGSCR